MRKQVNDTRTAPYQWFCSVWTSFENKTVSTPNGTNAGTHQFGTGTLITRRHVLTCAHNLVGIRKVRGRWRSEEGDVVRIKIGRNDDGTSVLPWWFRAKRIFIHPKFRSYRSSSGGFTITQAEYDYAIIELRSAVGDRTFSKLGRRRKVGWWRGSKSWIRPVEGTFKSSLREKKVNQFGYPNDHDTSAHSYGDPPHGVPFIDFDSVLSVGPRLVGKTRPLIRYRADTRRGHSGGPVWVMDRNTKKRYLVGVHAVSESGRNRLGVMITDDVIAQLGKWGVSKSSLAISSVSSVH